MFSERVQSLLSQMSFAEKVGQLRQCGPSLVGAFEVPFGELLDMMFDGRISEAEFGRLMATSSQDYREDEIRAGLIGSFNGVGNRETALRLQKLAVEESPHRIPLLFGYDIIHGFRTVTPIPLAESCAWDQELWQRTACMAACEGRSAGIHLTFAPMVDVAKDARWGRVSEGAGEDTLLQALHGAAKVRGFQGDSLNRPDTLAACVKHFAAYGAPEAGKDYNRVDMSPQRLYEEYLPPYEACIEAGARAIMPAFNEINGVPCSSSPRLLRSLLREEWGFTGVTVSDANAIAELVNHGVAADKAAAAYLALQAGMDIDMTSESYHEELVGLAVTDPVTARLLDEAAGRVLALKEELGLFANPYLVPEQSEADILLSAENRALAREAAQKSIVLLKNDDGILPLAKGARVALLGELGADRGEMTGAWAIGGRGDDCVSLLDAMQEEEPDVRYCSGIMEEVQDLASIDEAIQETDVVILALGEMKNQSGEAASRADITLPALQIERFRYVKAQGKKVVVVLFNGRPLAIPELAAEADAIVEAWHLGVEAGHALADVLFGRVNPSAKLTTTFPSSTGQCPIYYAHTSTGRPGGRSKFTSKYLDTPLEPLYCFGHGLSYTTYRYANLQAAQQGNDILVSVDIENTGDRDGEEIVQVYVRQLTAARTRPVKKLADFTKLFIAAGVQKRCNFVIPAEKLGYYDEELNFVVEAGEYRIFAGTSVENVLATDIELQI